MSAARGRNNGVDRLVRGGGRRLRNSSAAVWGAAALRREGGVVLRYHSVCDDPEWIGHYVQPSLVVPPATFDEHVAFLSQRHNVVALSDMAAAIREGRRVDRRSVAITFDDGYLDNYVNAFPVLRKHGVTATFFVTTGALGDAEVLWTVALRCAIRSTTRNDISLSFLGSRSLDVSSDQAKEQAIKMITGIVKRCKREEIDGVLAEVHEAVGPHENCRLRRIMMNRDEIREMHGAGMDIGGHTVSHFNLPSLDTSDIAREVVASRRDLEEELGAPVENFAYPNGRTDKHCDSRVAKLVALAGFRSAATSLSGPVSRRWSEFCIPRLGVAPRHRDIARLAADIQYSRLRHQDVHVVDEITRAFPANGAADVGPR